MNKKKEPPSSFWFLYNKTTPPNRFAFSLCPLFSCKSRKNIRRMIPKNLKAKWHEYRIDFDI